MKLIRRINSTTCIVNYFEIITIYLFMKNFGRKYFNISLLVSGSKNVNILQFFYRRMEEKIISEQISLNRKAELDFP